MNNRCQWPKNSPRVLLGLMLAASAVLHPGRSAADAVAADAAPAGAAAAPPAPSTPGSWQQHQYTFQFMGFTSTYSCDGLADKLKVLLLAAGARADLKSQAGVCALGFGRPDKFAQAYLTFHTLTPLPADRAPTDEKAVPGNWRAVAFASRSPRALAVGDCELVEQFRTNVLPMFTVRGIDDHTTCVPHQESGSVINLKFEVFSAVAKQVPSKSSAAPVPKTPSN